ncbi:Growth arrest and DNA damage-inducible protein GADD45 alpha [Xenoophorus captivus]|uniref:Growth arrest and DNA damage-inducible protein GADD45 alpha n=1 Tax=Xenoophorus captivus TaxID=1517983 RepID=A0ABV0SCC6_9TELE
MNEQLGETLRLLMRFQCFDPSFPVSSRMESVAQALEDVLSSALPQGCITVGVYEAAKSLNADPDNVVLCVLATDDEEDVALQIHFTLIQAFCCENDINILRVGNMRRLAEILGGVKPVGEPMDVHCVLVTVSPIAHVCLPFLCC